MQNVGHGTVTVSPDGPARQGTEITLNATPDIGYHFKEWKVVSDSVTIVNDKFTMPEKDVTVTAVFEKDAAPSFTTQPQAAVTVAPGQTATFTVSAEGAPVPTYQWQVKKKGKDWENIDGAIGDKYTTEAATKSMDGWQYQCVATNSIKSVESTTATLAVKSTDTGVQAISVGGTAGEINGTTITVTLPLGTPRPTDSSKITITPAAGATFSAPVTTDGGAEWTFTVTAEDGKATQEYMISIVYEPHDHKLTWKSDSANHWQECTLCDWKEESAAHTYDNDADTTCDTCGYMRTVTPSEPDKPDTPPAPTCAPAMP